MTTNRERRAQSNKDDTHKENSSTIRPTPPSRERAPHVNPKPALNRPPPQSSRQTPALEADMNFPTAGSFAETASSSTEDRWRPELRPVATTTVSQRIHAHPQMPHPRLQDAPEPRTTATKFPAADRPTLRRRTAIGIRRQRRPTKASTRGRSIDILLTQASENDDRHIPKESSLIKESAGPPDRRNRSHHSEDILAPHTPESTRAQLPQTAYRRCPSLTDRDAEIRGSNFPPPSTETRRHDRRPKGLTDVA
ncbi:unnamed protein product [Arctogadus glacialis]